MFISSFAFNNSALTPIVASCGYIKSKKGEQSIAMLQRHQRRRREQFHVPAVDAFGHSLLTGYASLSKSPCGGSYFQWKPFQDLISDTDEDGMSSHAPTSGAAEHQQQHHPQDKAIATIGLQLEATSVPTGSEAQKEMSQAYLDEKHSRIQVAITSFYTSRSEKYRNELRHAHERYNQNMTNLKSLVADLGSTAESNYTNTTEYYRRLKQHSGRWQDMLISQKN
ncbi:hypothetical protein BCR43DRAFT_541979 [Syncephalastrum racemosum]|uniref:Uncharacterized protein n=1 Tax=Syncephalastrum racemosum TaxID=13706 RepID=A0A1X2HQP5_SYNRA|nr:hypothetical protein BCR43DRAFT_541979 [Syncephalastrum racemosum]